MTDGVAMRERATPRIRVRLTLMYSTTLLVLLLASAGLLRLVVRTALEREFETSVRASAALVSQFFRVEIGEYQHIEAALSHIATELVFEDRVMHLHRPDSSEFVALGAPRVTKPHVLAPPTRRIMVPLDDALAPGWTIVVEASAASLAGVESRLDRWIGLGIPLLILLATVPGWWLTGRSLRPVGRMADAAARIAPGSGGRIPVDDASDELGRLATRFNALLDRLDGALDQQRRFLADAAHELRTPLARVRSRVEVALLSSRPSTDHAPSVLPAVNDELIRMSRLVDELLQLARADSGRDAAPAAMPLLYLDDVVTDELHRWHLEAERAGITLQCSMLQESRVRGDAVLLARLVGVFVDNALRYGRRGGSVDVRVIAGDRHVTLEVEDDGIGIAPDEQPRLFERFFRGARARAQRADGSGLGLAIAQWIVRQHLGTIAIAAGRRDTGTLVTVTLPHEGAPTRERSAAPPARHTAAVE